jgi:hypothetical protein
VVKDWTEQQEVLLKMEQRAAQVLQVLHLDQQLLPPELMDLRDRAGVGAVNKMAREILVMAVREETVLNGLVQARAVVEADLEYLITRHQEMGGLEVYLEGVEGQAVFQEPSVVQVVKV